MMRDFNDLQFFAAVVAHHGFSAAARALGLPKSRVSRRVALLEERLGVRLLDRTTRGLGLTQVGQQVFEHARAAVIEAEAAEEAALRMQTEPRGLVRLSCPLGLQGAIAGPLPGFLAAHPQLRVQCIATNRRVDLIHEGVDVAIRVRERLDTDADLQVKRIGVSRRILVASPGLLATVGVPMSPSDLANFPVLHQEEQSGGTWHFDGGRMPRRWNYAAASYLLQRCARSPSARSSAAEMERHRRHPAPRLCLATRHVAKCPGGDRLRCGSLEIVSRLIERAVGRSFTR
jgi:DNA-binding transcriptional LysR family regulator